MNRPPRRMVRFLPALAGFLLAAGPLRAAPTIEDLAPRDTIALLTVDDYASMREALARTPIADLLHEPEVQDWFASFFAKDSQAWRGAARDRGLNPDHLPRPSGAVGAAVWVDPAAVSPMIVHLLLSAEMGADADLFEKNVASLIERAQRDGIARVSDLKIAGLGARRVEFPRFHEDLIDGGILAAPNRFFLVRVGTLFLACTDDAELGRAVARARGAGPPSARDRPELAGAMRLVGPAHLALAVLAQPLFDAIERGARSDAGAHALGGLAGQLRPLLDALGFSPIEVYAVGLRFDAPEAMMVARAALTTPRKEGLLALLDAPITAFDLPLSVRADAADVRRFGLQYARVAPTMLRLVAALPDEMRGQANAMAGLLTAAVGPLLQTLGPDTTVARRFIEPLSPTSERGVTIVLAQDDAAVLQTIARVGALIGLKRRGADGERVWAMRDGQSLAVTDDRLVIARSDTIDALLNPPLDGSRASLMDTERFRRAAAFTRPGAVFYSYLNLPTLLRWVEWKDRHWEDTARRDLHDLDPTPGELAAWIKHERARRAHRRIPPYPPTPVVIRHVGDMVAEIRSTPDGFIYRGAWFAAPD